MLAHATQEQTNSVRLAVDLYIPKGVFGSLVVWALRRDQFGSDGLIAQRFCDDKSKIEPSPLKLFLRRAFYALANCR